MLPQGAYSPPPAVHRLGKGLYIRRMQLGSTNGFPLPCLCVKCGVPSTSLLRRTFYWHEPWVYLLILPGLLIYAIVALATRRQMLVSVPLCAWHRARRRHMILLAWAMVAAGIGLVFVFGCAGGDMLLAGGLAFLTILGGGVLGAISSNPMKPRRIDEEGGTFVGCGEAFLRQLP